MYCFCIGALLVDSKVGVEEEESYNLETKSVFGWAYIP